MATNTMIYIYIYTYTYTYMLHLIQHLDCFDKVGYQDMEARVTVALMTKECSCLQLALQCVPHASSRQLAISISVLPCCHSSRWWHWDYRNSTSCKNVCHETSSQELGNKMFEPTCLLHVRYVLNIVYILQTWRLCCKHIDHVTGFKHVVLYISVMCQRWSKCCKHDSYVANMLVFHVFCTCAMYWTWSACCKHVSHVARMLLENMLCTWTVCMLLLQLMIECCCCDWR